MDTDVGENGEKNEYETYKYNYFTRPRKPYIFGTVLNLEDQPSGSTSYLEQSNPLQEGIDKRKRQIDDNCDYVNGVVVVDTDITTITLAESRKIQYDPQSVIYGPGVSGGVKREYGQSLPAIVLEDMQHSIVEVDNIWGATDTYRGEGSKAETATGRAILREEAATRQGELVTLVDYLSHEMYKWQFQLIKMRFTENRLHKCIGAERAGRVLDLIQDDYEDGIDIKIIPGQVLPDDKVFRAERASEDFRAGVLDPVTYFETVGGYDNPQEVAKRFVMFRQNPFSVLEMTDEDIAKMQKANELLAAFTPQPQPQESEAETMKADQAMQMREKIKELVGSEEFQKLSPEKQKVALQKIRASIKGRIT